MSLSPMLITGSGITTTYLPLSTAYPAQAGCSAFFVNPVVNGGGGGGGEKLFAFDPEYAAHNSGPACMPPEATLWWGQDTASNLTTRTELGGYKMVCPESYKTVAMSVLDQSSTRVGCCPSGYNFVDWATAPNAQQCSSPLPAGPVTYVQAVPSGTWTTTSTSLSQPSPIWGVQINGILFAKPAATGASATATSSAPSNTASSDSTDHSSGLGRGAKIGIGVGSASGLVLLFAVLLFGLLFWRKKRAAITTSPSQVAIGFEYPEKHKSVHYVKTEETHDEQLVDSSRHVGMG
ncbi:uncharacterized protein RSE6_09368 [Rhynchosporium secalis]|uniref:Uncharacterized protein n=1 Tax=Rhynchosporium secalis TaxID=38038 RepID=A0A1E1MHQ4_RHYSE|nr:uncharacterized protein RSE6_09368 [Rhynchosporium secalis]